MTFTADKKLGVNIGNYPAFYSNRKIKNDISSAGVPLLYKPYYQEIGKNKYFIKTKWAQGTPKPQAKFKKISKSKMNAWLNEDGKGWRYLGEFKKFDIKSNGYKSDPFK